jgi:predicted KAP-like P-loop ATPase
MSSEKSNLLSPDKPLNNPKGDQLDYFPFARTLADSILKMTPPEGLVISIHGPWGSGKSTVLNFITYHFNQFPQNERPIVVRFNPWWFTGQEDLTRRFFNQLSAILEQRNIGSDLLNLINSFAEIVSEIPLPYASTGKALFKMAQQVVSTKPTDVFELKDKIADLLRKQQRRILVILDDIDRLTTDEVRDIFRLIKAVADFPNIIYLLAFDKSIVIKALEKMQEISGEEYLEKIVQVPFELPLPDKLCLRRLLFKNLDTILAGISEEDFDKTYWGNVYLEGIDYFINTPRDVVRLINTLSVIYPSVKGEVNTVDLIALETLRVFCPFAYETIRKNPDEFIGYSDYGDKDIKAFHETWLTQINEKEREQTKRLLMRIFPKLMGTWGFSSYGSDWAPSWRKQLRLCSPEKFPIYFRLAIPAGDFSNAEMKAIVNSLGNPKSFAEKLTGLSNQIRPDGKTRLRTFLDRLEDYTGRDIPLEHISPLVLTLFDIGDKLLRLEDEPQVIFDFGNNIKIGRILWQVLKRLNESTRFELLTQAMTEGNAISIITSEIAIFAQQQGKYSETQSAFDQEMMVTAEHLQALETIGLEKLRQAAKENTLLHTPKLPALLYRWRDWSGVEEPRAWVQKVITNDDNFIYFLTTFLGKAFGQIYGDSVGRVEHRLDPKAIEPFLNLADNIERVRTLANREELDEKHKIALNLFLKGYETVGEE